MQRKRSDIAKLISKAREIWQYSAIHASVKKSCKIESGVYKCQQCKKKCEVIHVDHKIPIGKQPTTFQEFGQWLTLLFCDTDNLQGLCTKCHNKKTKKERQKGRRK